jgi:two-component system nitrate/nitrite response regulator NarL
MIELRVLIIGSDPLARAGLAALLAGYDSCTVVGQVAAGDDLSLDVYRPDVLLWDLGWDAEADVSRLAGDDETPPLVALLPDDSLVSSAWTAGARGLLRRDSGAEKLLAALAAVVEGLAVVDPAWVNALALASPEPLADDLTPRELEVLRMVAEGLSNKEIAQRLAISEHTVKFHLNAILGKLGAQSRTEAVVSAIRRGLISV